MSSPTKQKQKQPKSKSPKAVATPTPATGLRLPAWLLAVILAAVTFALYWPATQCAFLNTDDDVYITDNAHTIEKGLTIENIQWAFVNTVSANWHPLTTLSHMLDCQLYGLKPWGHHLTGISLHMLNTVLFFLLLRTLTGTLWRSALAAAVFGWHPLHVESVAWVAERKDVLSCAFWLLTLWAYTKYVRSAPARKARAKVWYLAALALMALGLLSKPMLVTLPCVMLLLDYWPLGRLKGSSSSSSSSSLSQLVIEKLPFFALAIAMSAVTLAVQNQGGAVNTFDRYPLDTRLENAPISYCRYLWKFVCPTDLAIFYPRPASWPVEEVVAAGLFLFGISVAIYLNRGRYPYLVMGWLWFLGTLVPVIGLVQVGEQSMADRYTYIPSMGLLVLVIWGASELWPRWANRVTVLSLIGAGALAACCFLTRQQLGYWRNNETIYKHAIAVTQNNAFAINNLGCALIADGRFEEAVEYLEEGLKLRPGVPQCQNNLANALLAVRRVDEAIYHSQEAIRLDPNFARAHLILGNAYFDKGRVDDAMAEYQQSVRLEPGEAINHINLGATLLNKGRLDEAISEFQTALQLKPDNGNAHYNLGEALLKQGQTAAAISHLQEAVRLNPKDTDAQRDLANALKQAQK